MLQLYLIYSGKQIMCKVVIMYKLPFEGEILKLVLLIFYTDWISSSDPQMGPMQDAIQDMTLDSKVRYYYRWVLKTYSKTSQPDYEWFYTQTRYMLCFPNTSVVQTSIFKRMNSFPHLSFYMFFLYVFHCALILGLFLPLCTDIRFVSSIVYWY